MNGEMSDPQRPSFRVAVAGDPATVPRAALVRPASVTHAVDMAQRVITLDVTAQADGITLNTVATGKIATDRLAKLSGSLEAAAPMAREQVPAGRLGTPEEYGDLVAFLCSERAAYLTGTTIPIDGGLLRAI